jgi:hypothetical protein
MDYQHSSRTMAGGGQEPPGKSESGLVGWGTVQRCSVGTNRPSRTAVKIARFMLLFAQVLRSTSPGSRLAFTSMDADKDNRPQLFFDAGLFNRFVQSALRAVGEPLRWGISPASLPAFLSAAGYRPIEQPAQPELRARFLDPIGLHEEPLAPYEHLCLAEVVATPPSMSSCPTDGSCSWGQHR